MPRLLISSCLLGNECKYCGGSNRLPDEALSALRGKYTLVPVCPEFAGGLSVPREPSERIGDKVIMKSGRDVTGEYAKGAAVAAALARRFDCTAALMKAHSPSCGSGQIYDGTFSGVLIVGDGAAVERLRALDIQIYSEHDVDALLKE